MEEPEEPAFLERIREQIRRPMVFFDLETTGVDINTAKIVEICLVKIYPSGYVKSRDEFSTRINPGIPIPNSELHGITDEMVKDCPLIEDVIQDVVGFLQVSDLAGFNIRGYDIPLLLRVFRENNYEYSLTNVSILDVCDLYKILEPRNLDALFDQYVGRERENAHCAVDDTYDTIEAFSNMLLYHSSPDFEGTKRYLPDGVNEWLARTGDTKRVDLARKFIRKDDGEVYFNFSKHIGQKVNENPGMLEWMLKGDFDPETKLWCTHLLNLIKLEAERKLNPEPTVNTEEETPENLPFD